MKGWVSYECHTCQGTGEVDYRTYATGAITLEVSGRKTLCRDCDGAGKRWRPE